MQSISPETIFRGNDAWEKALPQIVNLTKSPLILGRSVHTNNIRNKIYRDLKNQYLSVNSANLQFDCCYEDISNVKNIIQNNNHDSVIAAGGGKVLDAGKYIAESLNIPYKSSFLPPRNLNLVSLPFEEIFEILLHGFLLQAACAFQRDFDFNIGQAMLSPSTRSGRSTPQK